MKRRIFFVANIIVPLLLGAVIYCLTSPDVIFMEAVRSLWGMPVLSEQGTVHRGIWKFIRYYLLDVLWAYALFFALYFSIGNNAAKLKMAFMIAVLFSTVMEAIQLFPIIPGYFDLLDILVEVLAETFAALIIKTHYEEARNICETK
ncbi:hypothetical protein SAMN04487770_13633 [Butyrivibrio sp. ob235]|uniref:hypothetical protein n=1 Tax=Butyrivibrio sp. ob235 TaxID=1761780 RepID=UPI0008B2D12D|nr:hypothetical protein [Butyrivibrio sp. ob235]SEM38823.1 hypothetical protein SAMN04487770_13633 [Butyrivibrio sp. ob235]